MVEVLKRKITRLFSSKADRARLFDAVNIVHRVVCAATVLIKCFYITTFRDNSTPLEIDDTLIDTVFQVLQGIKENPTRTGRDNAVEDDDGEAERAAKQRKLTAKQSAKEVKAVLFPRVKDCCEQLIGVQQKHGLPVSFILDDSKVTLLTMYKNNVMAHYEDYVKRYLRYSLRSIEVIEDYERFLSTAGTANPSPPPSAHGLSKDGRHMAAALTEHLVHGTTLTRNSVAYMDDRRLDVEFLRRYLCPALDDDRVQHLTSMSFRRNTDMDNRPWTYLHFMFKMNVAFETEFTRLVVGKRLYNPLCLSTSFIPSHIRISTSALGQLFMDKERIDEYKRHYYAHHGLQLTIHSKADLLKSYTKATNVSGASEDEEGQHATRLWRFVFPNLDNKHFKEIMGHTRSEEWCFDNSILTDGYSASFQIIQRRCFGRKKWAKKEADKAEAKKRKKTLVSKKAVNVKSGERQEFPHIEDDASTIPLAANRFETLFLSCDPGKGCIGTFSDGCRCLKYTSAHKDADTFKASRTAQQLKHRKSSRWMITGSDGLLSSIYDFETSTLSTTSRSSCTHAFFKYVEQWLVMRDVATASYKHPIFRQHKFLVHCKTKSSTDKFMKCVEETFADNGHLKERYHPWMDFKETNDPVINYIKNTNVNPIPSQWKPSVRFKPVPRAHRGRRRLRCLDRYSRMEQVHPRPRLRRPHRQHRKDPTLPPNLKKIKIHILYGDWGRNPNLKRSAPTPGIGFRRKVHRRFRTTTVGEAYTSKTCPCCRTQTMENERIEETFLSKFYGPKLKVVSEKHHLLRCTNVDSCLSRWWHRDACGSYNILYNGIAKILACV